MVIDMSRARLLWPSPRGWVVILVAGLGAAGAVWAWRQYLQTYHLATVRDGVLYRDGVRSLREFRTAVARVHPKTIVSLVDDTEITHEPFTDEMAFCRDHGIDVVRIPIQLGGWPLSEQLKQFLDLAADPQRQPLLVHCAQGVRRTGMMVAAYQESILGYSGDQARSAMLTFGHSQRTAGDVQRFIEFYDPASRSLTRELEMSKE